MDHNILTFFHNVLTKVRGVGGRSRVRYCFSMSKFTFTRLLAKISTFSLRVDALRTLQVCRKQREESREGQGGWQKVEH
ncbi:hypothetical protein POTOM_024958 [Populus tomentosa]|uniref:Uncharacterized protein n=1 Tax=Populus tomentosa TaxID=118781 RepID=A0A8X8CWY8_POPTO|nr:hypothetical protein POTOM_024958 [Populus tomentosa]